MPRTVSPDSLGFVITDVGRLLRAAVERRIAEKGVGVTPGEARALMHVAALGDGRQTVIAERMGVEPMTVSAYLDRLEKCGLVERRPDPSDGRAKRVVATDAADALIDEVRGAAASVLDHVMVDVDARDRVVFEKTLTTVRASLQALLGAGGSMDKPLAGMEA